MKEAHLYKKFKENKVQCLNCAHYCSIEENKRGICRTRENQKGKLFALNYRKAVALNIDPIEKKPFFHFLPGTYSLSLASWGCNFKCLNCQNWTISQQEMEGEEISPEQIIDIALKNNLPSISYTYTEPTVFSEYALETMKLARKKKIKNAWVSNGYWSEELFKTISPFLDAANIDLKGFSEEFYLKNCSARLEPVKETLKRLKKKNIWTEITTLLIPGLNDLEQELKAMAQFIKALGPEIPWHITKFSPEVSWKLKDVKETSRESLKKAHLIGKEAGLRYVYTGNIPGMDSESTFCPKCNTLAIKRLGYEIIRHDLKGRCPNCKENLNII